jgi:hypothetical protein
MVALMPAQTCTTDTRIVLGDALPTGHRTGRRLNLHLALPVLLGLSTPLLVVALIDPAVLGHGRVIIQILLTTLFLISTVLFAASLLWPGDISAIIFDPKARVVEIVQSGLIATTRFDVPFDQVVQVGPSSTYDHDGYIVAHADLVLRSGRRLPLPANTSAAAVAAARRALGKI